MRESAGFQGRDSREAVEHVVSLQPNYLAAVVCQVLSAETGGAS
jgi:hypothetical protein